MSWTNYHTHCNFCDGKVDPELYAKEAIEQGMLALGFSSHAPFLYETAWAMKEENLESYLASITRLKKQYKNNIDIHIGLEVDFIHNQMGPSRFKKYNLDYIIGSVHFINQYSDGKFWGIDASKEDFQKGLEIIYGNNVEEAVKTYYDCVAKMLITDKPDIIGHFDIIKKNNKDDCFFSEEESWYKEYVQETLKYVKSSGCIVEVNTRGLVTGKTIELYPSNWILDSMFELNIPITISSDAHNPDQVSSYFKGSISITGVFHFSKKYW